MIHLDGFARLPSWTKHPKVLATLHSNRSTLGAAGKFDCLTHASETDRILVVDDDVEISRNLVRTLSLAVERQSQPSVVGAHGSLLPRHVNSCVRDRTVLNVGDAVSRDTTVDVLATCLCMFRKSQFEPRPSEWRYRNMVDLQFALEARQAGINLVSIRRKRRPFWFLDSNQPGSIFEALNNDDSNQPALARRLIAS